jgi:hypothetical protein
MTDTMEKNLKINNGEWQPLENEIAVRLSESELQSSRVIVSPWQTGLLIVDGVVKGRSVGKQDLRGFWGQHFPIFRSAKSVEILLARNGLVTLLVNAVNTRSQDGLLFDILCRYKVEIENFEQFWHHFMQSKKLVLTEDLAAEINRPLRETIRSYASRVESTDLREMPVELGLRFVDEIEPVLQEHLAPLGLRLVMIEPPQCQNEAFGKAQQRAAQRRDTIEESRADLAFQREKFEIDQAAYELETKIGALEFEKLADELKSKASLEQVSKEVKGRAAVQSLNIQAGVLKALDEYLKGRRAAQEAVEDAEIERASKLERDRKERQHLLAVVEVERSIALSNLRNRFQLESLKHAGLISSIELDQKIANYEKQSRLEKMQLECTLQNKRMVDEYTYASLLQKHGINLKIVAEKAMLDILLYEKRARKEEEIRQVRVEHEQDMKDRETDRRLREIERLAEIQTGRMKSWHDMDMEK